MSPSSSTNATEQAAAAKSARVACTDRPSTSSSVATASSLPPRVDGPIAVRPAVGPTLPAGSLPAPVRSVCLTATVEMPVLLRALPDDDARRLLKASRVNNY